jgi:hypothetical protein
VISFIYTTLSISVIRSERLAHWVIAAALVHVSPVVFWFGQLAIVLSIEARCLNMIFCIIFFIFANFSVQKIHYPKNIHPRYYQIIPNLHFGRKAKIQITKNYNYNLYHHAKTIRYNKHSRLRCIVCSIVNNRPVIKVWKVCNLIPGPEIPG